jgi:WD40-like Beta Propeller Repeat
MTNILQIQMWRLLSAVLVATAFFAVFCSAAVAQQFGPWSAPVNLNNLTLSDGTVCPAVVNSAFNDSHPAISKDGLSLIFATTRPGPDSTGQVGLGNYDLWVTQRDSLEDCWQEPRSLGPTVNSAFQDFAPNLTTDGHWLYFHSTRPTWVTADGVVVPSCGRGANLYASHRKDKRDDFGWEAPINLGCTINTPGFVTAGPTYFEDDATGTNILYFTAQPVGASDIFFDIYVSTCKDDLAACNKQQLWGPGTLVDALNNTPDNKEFRNTRTAIRRRDGLEMILSSGRPGSLASENLWVSTRATTQDQNWLPPVPVNCDSMPGCPAWDPEGPLVNSPDFDGGPALSWDGTELYLFRVRADLANTVGCVETPASGPVCRNLYVSKRTKLTRPD